MSSTLGRESALVCPQCRQEFPRQSNRQRFCRTSCGRRWRWAHRPLSGRKRANWAQAEHGWPALLTAYRMRAGLTVSALARAVTVHYSHLSRLEKGERTPNCQIALALASALHLTDAEELVFLRTAGGGQVA